MNKYINNAYFELSTAMIVVFITFLQSQIKKATSLDLSNNQLKSLGVCIVFKLGFTV